MKPGTRDRITVRLSVVVMSLASLTLPVAYPTVDGSVIKPEQLATSIIRVPQIVPLLDGIQGSG